MRALLDRLANLAQHRPGWLLGLVLTLHLLGWWVAQLVAQPNLSLDGLEMLAWGHSWLLASPKHPTLPGWIAELMALATGNSEWGQFLLGPLCVVSTFWLVWRLGLRITTPLRALLGVLALEGVIYFTFTSPEFNNNVVLYPFWAATALATHRAISTGRWRDWLLMGLCAGLAMNGKYVSALLVLSLLGFLLSDPQGRRSLLTAKPWAAVVLMGLTMLPHVWGLWLIDFRPVLFPLTRADIATSQAQHLLFPLKFLGAQAIAVLGAVIIVLLAYFGDKSTAIAATPLAGTDRRFLLWVALGPCVLAMLASGIGGREMRSMWGSPMWNFIGLALATLPARPIPLDGLRRSLTTGLVLGGLALLAFIGKTGLAPLVRGEASRANFPGQALADRVLEGWETLLPNQPLTLVAGDPWLAGNIGFYAAGRPAVILEAEPALNPWLTAERLANEGAIIVWRLPPEQPVTHVPDWLAARFPTAQIQQPLSLPPQALFSLPGAPVGWAILPPATASLSR